MGAVRKDWSGFQYISCPNQVHLARNSCQPNHKGTAAALYGPNSDHRPEYPFVTACCAGNVARMLPTYVQRMWMSAPSNGLAAVLYGPSRVAGVVGKAKQTVEITEETSYPFSDRITFRVRAEQPAEFPLYLRDSCVVRQSRSELEWKIEGDSSDNERIFRAGTDLQRR